MPAIAPITAQNERIIQAQKRISRKLRQAVICILACLVLVQGILADTVTYQQLRQDQGGRASTAATTPVVARTSDPPNNPKNPTSNAATPQEPRAQESPNHPEFVRLPDGRIVRYGPGVICDENCVEPVGPSAFRGPGPAFWWIVPPIVAGGILCAILCRPDDDNPTPTPTITIPPTSPTPTVSPVSPTPTPTATATPPPAEIPEPGTLILVGLGLGTMLARRRKKKQQD